MRRFIWDLHHFALGQGSIDLMLKEDLEFDLTQLSLSQIETSKVLLSTSKTLSTSQEIEQKLNEIERTVLLREIEIIRKQNDEEELTLSFKSLNDDEREKLILQNEHDLEELSNAKLKLLEGTDGESSLKIEKMEAEEALLAKKNLILKEGLQTELLKANLELQEALEKGNQQTKSQLESSLIVLQEKEHS